MADIHTAGQGEVAPGISNTKFKFSISFLKLSSG